MNRSRITKYICCKVSCPKRTRFLRNQYPNWLDRIGIGHESLTIIVRFAPILVSAIDPGSLVRKLTSLRLSIPALGTENPLNNEVVKGIFSGAQSGNRTRTAFRPQNFKSCVATNYTTRATATIIT